MKILIPLVGTFSKEGGWRVLSELANAWQESGHEVTFLSHKHFRPPYYPTTAKILFYDNKGRVYTNGDERYPRPFGGPFALRYLLRKALDSMEADVVLATLHFTVEPIKKSRIAARKYYYVQAYEPEFYDRGPLRYRIYRRMAVASYKQGLPIIVNAPMYKNYKEIQSNRVIYPGIRLDVFYPDINRRKTGSFIMGSIGRTEVFKGTAYVLEAFRELREEMGDVVELHLAFGNKEWEEIDGVVMHYPKDDQELANFYRSLDCYVCAQYIQLQAVHYPVIESMACGIPVVTTGYYPSSEDNAWLVGTHSSKDITNTVKRLMNDPVLAVKKSEIALQSIAEFEWSKIADKMITYLQE